MAPADLSALLHVRPFRPFRVITDGMTYEVLHPEMVLVSLATAVIGYPDERDPRVAVKNDIVSMRHIVRLEPGEIPA